MKRIHYLLACLFFLSVSLSACFDGNGFNCIESAGDPVTQSFDLPEFTGVKLAMSGEVRIMQGSPQSVEITGSQNILDKLDLEIREGILVINMTRCLKGNDPLIFDITLPEIEELSVSGSGLIQTQAPIQVDDLALNISGSGLIKAELTGNSVETKVSGSGDMQLSGSTKTFGPSISGSGNIQAFDLMTKRANTRITGSGNMELTVEEALDVRITGEGDVYYKGSPPDISVNITGSGRLINAN